MNHTAEQALRAYEAALASYDWEQIGVHIHSDACFIFSTGTHHGKEAIGAAMQQVFAAIRDEHYRISELRWVMLTPQFASCTYRFDWSGLIDGVPASGAGRGSCVLVNVSGKGWLLLSEHLGPLASN